MPMEFTIPGTLGPRIEARRSLLGGVQLFADGTRLRRQGRWRGTYPVQASDGSLHELRLNHSLATLKVRVDGHEIELERPLARWEVALTILPLALIFVGGLFGGLFGGAAAEVNRRVARSSLRMPSKVVAMLAVGLASALLWFGAAVGIGVLVSPVPEFATGTCISWPAADMPDTTLEFSSVDCRIPHDAEVIANLEHPDGSYPGEDALWAFASVACLPAFESYVGVPYSDSRLMLHMLWPEQLLWLKGDRTVDCLAADPDGIPLTGSVRGSRQ